MRVNNLFLFLQDVFLRPKPFEIYTAAMLWNDAYISKQLLGLHLDPSVDMVSRSEAFMDRATAWLGSQLNISAGTSIADFGCGPGFYAHRFAKQGASVTGIDISQRSIEYARQTAHQEGLSIEFICQDYLKFATPKKFDLIVMIFCEFCSLGPVNRRLVLKKFNELLTDGGVVVLDVFSPNAYDQREECSNYEHQIKDGFWSAEEYFGFLNTFKYDSEKVILDKYTLVEKERIRTFYNWVQYYDQQTLGRIFEENGFEISSFHENIAGMPYKDDTLEFAVMARKK